MKEHYSGTNTLGNLDVEDTLDALFIALWHLYDWLHEDSSILLDKKTALDPFIKNHPISLDVCRAYANTRKHMKRDRPGQIVAQITTITAGPKGYSATIGYRPWDQPATPFTEVDALALALQCENDWHELLKQHRTTMPT